MKKIYLFANWKMYLDYDESNILANAIALAVKDFSPNTEMAIFPSSIAFYPVCQVLSDVGIGCGPQNVYWTEKGGYTGEVSAEIYKMAGAKYSLVGHSERRHVFGETEEEINKKMQSCLDWSLTPVLCVGETLDQKKEGVAKDVVKKQLEKALDGLKFKEVKELFVAYEPVWAIGTGESCSVVDAQNMQGEIKKWVKELLAGLDLDLKVLYGGSVRPENVVQYVENEEIDGVLVGGASTKMNSWSKIAQAI